MTLAALAEADVVLAVGSADPVGLQRLVRGVGEVRASLPDVMPRPVITRLRSGPVPGDPAVEVRRAIQRHLGLEPAAIIPDDRSAYDTAMARAQFLRELAPGSPARRALAALAHLLAGELTQSIGRTSDHGATEAASA